MIPDEDLAPGFLTICSFRAASSLQSTVITCATPASTSTLHFKLQATGNQHYTHRVTDSTGTEGA